MKSWEITVTVEREDQTGDRVTHRFETSPITIGALSENDLVLDDPLVSGAHAHAVVARGSVVLFDHSRNGTFVNGERVERATLGEGSVVLIRPFHLRFVLKGGKSLRETSVTGQDTTGVPTFLEVTVGPADLTGKRLPMPASGLRIGRAETNGLAVNLMSISRHHAEILQKVPGEWAIRDLGSANGTHVNGHQVAESPLRSGDTINLGPELVLLFQHDRPSKAAGAATRKKDSRAAPPAAPPREARPAGSATPLPGRAAPPPLPAAPPKRARPSKPAPPSDDLPPTLPPGGPPLRIETKREGPEGGIALLTLSGRVDGYNYTELGQALDALVDAGELLIAVDLSALSFIDHTGLGALVKACASVEQQGGQFRLCGLSRRLAESFSLSRLDVFFKGKVLPDPAAAVVQLSRYLAQ